MAFVLALLNLVLKLFGWSKAAPTAEEKLGRAETKAAINQGAVKAEAAIAQAEADAPRATTAVIDELNKGAF